MTAVFLQSGLECGLQTDDGTLQVCRHELLTGGDIYMDILQIQKHSEQLTARCIADTRSGLNIHNNTKYLNNTRVLKAAVLHIFTSVHHQTS